MRSKKVFRLLLSVLLCFSAAALAQNTKQVDVQLISDNPHFKPGGDLSFEIRLNEPLPAGARFDVRLSPVGFNQELSVSSGQSVDGDRKAFILQTKLPDTAWAGSWHIAIVWLFLPGSSWATTSLSTNDMHFIVDGPPIPRPTTATATILGK
jgi:hypothetical protein